MLDTVRVRGVAGTLALVAAACAHTPPPDVNAGTAPAPGADSPPAPASHKQLMLGPEAVNHGKDVMLAWMTYGTARVNAYQKTPPAPTNTSADDYALEFEARAAQSAFWKEHRGKGVPAYALLDRQVEIWEAGFLPELIVSIYAHPGWTVPGAAIKGLRMQAFAKRFSGDYDNTLAVAIVPDGGTKFPSVPGGDFPDPDALPVGPESCGRLQAERAAAWRRWQALEPRLGGVPIAAADSVQFAGALERVKDDPAYLKRGATWVASRVGTLALLEGFCGVETQDWPRAVDMLTRAVGLMPQDTLARLELGTALNMVKRYHEALAQDRAVIEHSTDGCAIATAFRHQGYTFIDMGLLDSARLAYEKSLELEPNNPLATHELKVIAQKLATRHANPKAAGDYVPPPLGSVTITKCNRNDRR